MRTPSGDTRLVHPSIVLGNAGPVLQVSISVTPEHAAKTAELGKQPPEPVSGFALIDTGASLTAVDESVCHKLGLSPTGVIGMGHATGVEDRQCHPVQVLFPGSPLPPRTIPKAASCDLGPDRGLPYVLLFGRDLLTQIRLVYNGPAGPFEMAF